MPKLAAESEGSELSDLSEQSDHESAVKITSPRLGRRSKKSLDNGVDDPVSEASDTDKDKNEDDAEEVEPERGVGNEDSDSPLSSPPPESPPRKKIGRPRKSQGSTSKPSRSTPSPTKKRRAGGGRGGGNKRKHTHEYCLTCANYGRACSGRRDGHPGCAVCREPDRSKGEKLRECLWAEPEKGVYTYAQAKEILKIAQAEERARLGKAPTKRQLPYLSDQQKQQYLAMSDSVVTVEPRARTSATVPPPVSRPLNVVPPPSALRQRQFLAGIESRAAGTGPHRNTGDDADTIVVNRSARPSALQPSPKLFVEKGSSDDLPQGTPAYASSLSHQMAMQPLTDATGRRIPYYDPNLEAYVLPAYPHSNLLPPHMQGRMLNVRYMSVYDAYPFLPVAIPNSHVVTPSEGLAHQPRRRSSSSLSQISPPRPLDKSGTPTRRFQRSDSITNNVAGYEVAMKTWKSPAQTNGHIDGENMAETTTGKTIEPRGKRARNTSSPSTRSEDFTLSSEQEEQRKDPVAREDPIGRRDQQMDPIEPEDQPQIARSGSLSPQLHTQLTTKPTQLVKHNQPELKRKRFSRPATPSSEVRPISIAPENTAHVVESVESASHSIQVESRATGSCASTPSIGKFSRPSIAEVRQQRPSSSGSLSHRSSLTPSMDGVSPPVATSGWQAVNNVKAPAADAAPKTSPVRARKKRRTGMFDIQEDQKTKKT